MSGVINPCGFIQKRGSVMCEAVESNIRIYVACLASYNNGILHGAWINADQEVEAIRSDISAMLAASPISGAEEYALHDYEGFGSLRLSEWEGIEQIADYAAFITEHGDLGTELITHFGDMETARCAMEEDYIGLYESVADFAEEITTETTDIPESLRFYIDYEAMARDMVINDLIVIETGFEKLHLFWNR